MKDANTGKVMLVGFVALMLASCVLAGDGAAWPSFHGPQRNNISIETGLMQAWPETGPELLWTASGIGHGYSSVSIAEDRIFIAGMVDRQTYVTALDLKGKKLWQRVNGQSWQASERQSWAVPYSGSRGTPTVDGETVYHLSEMGRLAAFDVRTGQQRWHIDVLKTFDAERPKYGLSESVLIHGDALICCPGGAKGYVVALHKETGRTLWANTNIKDPVGYCSPIVGRIDDVEQVISMSANRIFSVDPKNGQTLWNYPFGNERNNSATDVIASNGRVYASTGYGGGSVLLRPQRQANGDFSVAAVWTSELLDNHHGGVLLLDNHLYGAGHESRGWFCLDFSTGRQRWQTSGKGTLTYADGRLYCLDERGTMTLVKATDERWEEAGSFRLPRDGKGLYWAHPVICGGRLYVRHSDQLYAYDVREDLESEISFKAAQRDGESNVIAAKAVTGQYGATLSPKMPVGSVVVPAVEGALAKAIGSHGTDTVFYLKAGVHTGNGEMRPKAGSVFIGERGAILDGGNATERCFVHDTGVIRYTASAARYVVTLRNLVVRNYCSADQECAVMVPNSGQGWRRALSDPADRNGWLMEHCSFISNRAGGACLGSASTARGCLFSDNGQIGIKACGRNVQLLACRSTRNNVDRKFNYMWEAGGTKFWGVKDMLVDGGEYDHNGGFGLWFDYVWDGNVVKNASFHHNLRPGISIEMAVGVEVTGCTFSHDDLDGLSGEIPAAFRPWDKSPKSGPDLWSGEIMLFNGCATGTYDDPVTKASYSFSGRTWIHGNTIIDGGGGILCQYQDRGGVNPAKQVQGSKNGPVGGLVGIVIEDNTIACSAGCAAMVTILPNRDYKDAAGSWGPIPATQAEAHYEGVVFRGNRYSGNVMFRVPKAALKGGSSDIWEWNGRRDIDAAKWRSLGKL